MHSLCINMKKKARRQYTASTLFLSFLVVAALAIEFRVFHQFWQLNDRNHYEVASPAATTEPTPTRTALRILKNETITRTSSRRQSSLAIPPPYNNVTATHRKWAYAFLVSGCHPDNGGAYRGFLYNIVVAVQRLRDLGSVADFVLFVQMSSASPSRTSLPPDEQGLLHRLNVQVHYLPRMRSSIHETFYAMVQEKFRVLQLTQYHRVLFLDGDILPLCNLDYMFALSEEQTDSGDDKNNNNNNNNVVRLFKENVILAEQSEAANAGFFLLTPHEDDWTKLQQVIQQKEEKALRLPWPHFDEQEGEYIFRIVLVSVILCALIALHSTYHDVGYHFFDSQAGAGLSSHPTTGDPLTGLK
jgi:hypothetical protein